MSRRIRILGPKDRTNTEDTLSASCNFELLVELGRLGEESFLAEIWESENICAAFGSCANEAGRFELLESAFLEIRTEEPLRFDPDILREVSKCL